MAINLQLDRHQGRRLRRAAGGDAQRRRPLPDDVHRSSHQAVRCHGRPPPGDQHRRRPRGGAARALRAGMARRDGRGGRRRLRRGIADLPPAAGACGLSHARGRAEQLCRLRPIHPAARQRRGRRRRAASARAAACPMRATRASTRSWPRTAARPCCRPCRTTSCRSCRASRAPRGRDSRARCRLRPRARAEPDGRLVPEQPLCRLRSRRGGDRLRSAGGGAPGP